MSNKRKIFPKQHIREVKIFDDDKEVFVTDDTAKGIDFAALADRNRGRAVTAYALLVTQIGAGIVGQCANPCEGSPLPADCRCAAIATSTATRIVNHPELLRELSHGRNTLRIMLNG